MKRWRGMKRECQVQLLSGITCKVCLVCLGICKVITKHKWYILFYFDFFNIQLPFFKRSLQFSLKSHNFIKYEFSHSHLTFFFPVSLCIDAVSLFEKELCIFLPSINSPSQPLNPFSSVSSCIQQCQFASLYCWLILSYICFFQARISLFNLDKSKLWSQSIKLLFSIHD